MGCTVVFLFGAVLLLFGLHYGVQLDRIGAWGRGGGREGSILIGQVIFDLLLLRSHATTLPVVLSLPLASHFGFRQPTTTGQGKSFPAAIYKIRQIPDRTNQQPRDVMQNFACICF